MITVHVAPDRLHAGQFAAALVMQLVRAKPSAVIGVATGSTPETVYQSLTQMSSPDELSAVRAFALDEYVGLDPSSSQSYRSVLDNGFVRPLGIDTERLMVPNGMIDEKLAAAEYDRAIVMAGGIDLQILGIGANGHVGFNEPGTPWDTGTRVQQLSERTRADNARFFASVAEVPTHALTQGIATIMNARHLVLLAFGLAKADAVAAALLGPQDVSVPASVVQKHPMVTVVLDEDAASGLVDLPAFRMGVLPD